MVPVPFDGHNIVFAKDQPEYQPLPAFRDSSGLVVSCWRLTFWERVKVLITGRVWLQQLTFNGPLQPQLPQVHYPFVPAPQTEAA